VAAHYRPLHPEVYSWLLPPHALSTQAPTFGINSNISCYLLPDVPEAGTHSQSLLEPYSGVFVFPLLAPWFCERIWSELHNYETNAQQSQHRTPADWLPLHVRHDGNMGNLQDCGFAPLLAAVEAAVQPFVSAQLPELGHVECYHAFLTRNWVGRDEAFKIHRDDSRSGSCCFCLIYMY